jgi:hypothetical protein
VLESAESECDTLDAFDALVHCFGRSVREMRLVPGEDLITLRADRASMPSDFWWACAVSEVLDDVINPTGRFVDVVVLVDRSHDFLSHNRPSVPVVSMVR